jgi:hypothetical protein
MQNMLDADLIFKISEYENFSSKVQGKINDLSPQELLTIASIATNAISVIPVGIA